MKYSKGMLYGVLGLILAHPAYAAVDCSSGAKPSCNALGYTETTCSSGSYVACPYDKTKKKCIPVAPTCEDLGFTVNDKSAWCTNIVECPTDTSYTLCAAAFAEDCESAGYKELGGNDYICEGTIEITLFNGTTATCAKGCITECTELDPKYGGDACHEYGFLLEDADRVYCDEKSQPYYTGGNGDEWFCGVNCRYVYDSCDVVEVYAEGECPLMDFDFINYNLQDAEGCPYPGNIYNVPTSSTGDGDFITCTDSCSGSSSGGGSGGSSNVCAECTSRAGDCHAGCAYVSDPGACHGDCNSQEYTCMVNAGCV